MMVLGIDPATRTGIAVVDGRGDLRFHRAVTPGISHRDRLTLLEEIAAQFPEIGAVAIEVPPKFGDKAASTAKVNNRAGEWMALVRLTELPEIVETMPSQWRSRVGMPTGRRTRETLKRMALAYCVARWGATMSEDEADAALIALAYACKGKP